MMRIAVLGRLASLAGEALEGTPCTIETLAGPSHLTPAHDVALCLSYPRLVPAEQLAVPRHGVFVSHASDLPRGRGWAPVNWALIRSDDRISVTTFQAVEECDAGPVFRRDSVELVPTDTIVTAYEKVKTLIRAHIQALVAALQAGSPLVLTPQSGASTWNPRRRPADSELDASRPLAELWPLLRACDNEAYPAYFRVGDKRVILRYDVVDGDAAAQNGSEG